MVLLQRVPRAYQLHLLSFLAAHTAFLHGSTFVFTLALKGVSQAAGLLPVFLLPVPTLLFSPSAVPDEGVLPAVKPCWQLAGDL